MNISAEPTLESWLEQPYQAYSYSYPHKSSYGTLDPPVDLQELWQTENRSALFAYVHLPFCEMRCGFCNLFTRSGGEDLYDRYLDSLELQFQVMDRCTAGNRKIARMALGGGTPTVLSPTQLGRLFAFLEQYFDATPKKVETSIETSPSTASLDRLRLLRELGVHRISIGVQSFIDEEVHAMGRPQQSIDVHRAIDNIRACNFPVLNIDLIYGQASQTLESWMASIETAIQYMPEELFLYPLYVRPETGLGRKEQSHTSSSSFYRNCYEMAKMQLLANGYHQFSMRSFRRINLQNDFSEQAVPYCCQQDGMLGLGCGARSYTQSLHYSSRFAVSKSGVAAIIDRWIEQNETDFQLATWGVRLRRDERMRRFIIQSILNRDGLDMSRLEDLFGIKSTGEFPELNTLIENGLLMLQGGRLMLTADGMGYSDSIGPFLYSEASRQSLKRFATSK
jgi:oxygen-independent coproporphyrinogen-3 oxidase